MSRYLILCPGPSLAKHRELPASDCVIAVNRAAIAFPCHIWAALDYPMIRNYQANVIGSPKLLTRRQTWKDIERRCRLELAMCVDEITPPPVREWNIKTMTVAMAYAKHMGATHVDLIGCDWLGDKDFDGAMAGEDRSDARWTQEQHDTTALMAWMNANGCEVKRWAC